MTGAALAVICVATLLTGAWAVAAALLVPAEKGLPAMSRPPLQRVPALAQRPAAYPDGSAEHAAAGRLQSTGLWTIRNGLLDYNLHVGQELAYYAPERFVWLVAGTQGGKTSFGPIWLLKTMDELGVGDYLAVTANYPLLELKMKPEFLLLFETTLGLGEWRESRRTFYCSNGSRVIFGSAQKPESLESATAKAAWLDECGQDQFNYRAYEAVLRRLSLHQGRLLGTTTLYNQGWLRQQVYEPWLAGDPTHRVIQYPSILNPTFPRAEYERARQTLPEWRFKMFYAGLFAKPAGLIYTDFIDRPRARGGHVVPDFDPPQEWPRYVGVDFGAVNTAVIWIAHDQQNDVFYIYDESLRGGLTAQEHCAQALTLAQGLDVRGWWGGSRSEGPGTARMARARSAAPAAAGHERRGRHRARGQSHQAPAALCAGALPRRPR